MTVFRASAALALLFAFSTVAAAQDAHPEATGAPRSLGAPAPSANTPVDAPTEFKPGALGKPDEIGVTGSEINVLDGPAVGLMDDANGGLGRSMWANASRAEIEDLLGKLPLITADPFVRRLSRRIVLTTSDAPLGQGKRALIAIRIEKLQQAGLVNEAGALAASLSLNNDPDFARVQADALLYAGRDTDVCSDLTVARTTLTDPYWLELRAWCFVVAGDAASAELTRGVLDAEGVKDPAFALLATDVIRGQKVEPKDIEHPTALHVYLLRKAGLPLRGRIAARLGTVANLFAARDARNAPADRLAAATRISATGALSPLELRAILDAQTLTPDKLAHTQALVTKLPFLPSQAVLRRAAKAEQNLAFKADLIAAALSADGHISRLPLTAALQEDLVLGLKPSPDTMKSRFIASRALILTGKSDAAARWYASDADPLDNAVFRVLLDVAAPSPQRDTAAQAALSWFAKNAAPQQKPSGAATLALGVADALGNPLPPQAKALAGTLGAMKWPGRRPTDIDVRKLVEASSAPGRRGEAVLRVLDIVGGDGPADLAPDVTVECVRALVQVGLTAEARALAVEALATARAEPQPA